jgi:prevent-host-death family protein
MTMKYHEAIKPISYLKAHASEIIRDINKNRKPLIITQRGEAKVVVQDIAEYDQINESLAMLKLLAMSAKNVADGKVKPAEMAHKDLDARIKALKDG